MDAFIWISACVKLLSDVMFLSLIYDVALTN